MYVNKALCPQFLKPLRNKGLWQPLFSCIGYGMVRKWILIICFSVFLSSGCEDTNLQLATEAGLDAVKAVTLTDGAVADLAAAASEQADRTHRIAPASGPYGKRLRRILGGHTRFGGRDFDIRAYKSPKVNAFAMADGTIRIYTGLMDMLNDHELLFVIGHEMGHVTEKHIKQKIRMAYAASALRKGVASQENLAGEIARSALGGFVEMLLNAQFSQAEEREADDCGVRFLAEQGIGSEAAVSALKKLAGLGSSHSFLSSHPAPEARARRLAEGGPSLEQQITEKAPAVISRLLAWIAGLLG